MPNDYLTSPIGDIQFLALKNTVQNRKDVAVYSIRLAFDSEKDAKWISDIAAINMNKPVTAGTYRGKSDAVKEVLAQGKTLISADTQFEVAVYDKEGNLLEEAPQFFAGDTGTAQMVVQPYTKSAQGGTINLMAVIVHNVENENSGGLDREARLAQLKETIALATKK